MGAVSFSRDGSSLAATSPEGAAAWSTEDGRLLFEVRAEEDSPGQFSGASWNPDGSRLALGGPGAAVSVVDVRDGRVLSRWSTGSWAVSTVAYSTDGATLAVGAGNLRILDAGTGDSLRALFDPTPSQSWRGMPLAVSVTGRGECVVEASGAGSALRWSGSAEDPERLDARPAEFLAAALSPEGSRVAGAGTDGIVRILSWDARGEVTRCCPPGGVVNAVAFSPDGGTLATGGEEGRVRLWSAATGEEIELAAGHDGPVYCVAVSPDGKRVATGGRDGTVRLWDAATGEQVRVLARERGPVRVVKFATDGHRIAFGGWERRVTVVDAETGEVSSTSVGLAEEVREIVFAADGSASAAPPVEMSCPPGHGDRVTAVLSCAGGPDLLSASWDGTIRRWDLAEGRETGRVEAPGVAFNALALSPDGRTAWAARSDGTVVGYAVDALAASK